MRKKVSEDRVVTESILDSRKYVTEERLEEILDSRFALFKKEIKAEIMIEVDLRFERFGYKMEEMFIKWSSKMFDRIDPLLGEIEIAREDREISTYQMREMKGELKDHEGRIKKLESN